MSPRREPASPLEDFASTKPTAVATTPTDLVKRIQDATVYIKVQAGRLRGSGSGFVIHSQGDTVLIATNDHVVNLGSDATSDEHEPRRPGLPALVTVVFRSGGDLRAEQSLPASIIASDNEGNCDLAVLQVRGVRNPPEPIGLAQAPEPALTTLLLIYGFPLGNLDARLDPSVQRNPSITVNRGSVSSLKHDRFNKLSLVQIDGSINPGNSGGPAVDEKGRLLGVVVAKIAYTNIGFAVPAGELNRMLAGHLGSIALAMQGERSGEARLQVQVRLIDPLKHIESVDFLYEQAPARVVSAAPDADGNWAALPHARTVKLVLRGGSASADFNAHVGTPTERRLMVQAAYRLAGGKLVYTSPRLYEVPSRPTGLTRTGGGPRADGRPIASFKALGPLVDPSKKPVKDSRLQSDSRSLTIEVPAGVRVLSPALDTKNAPMTLADVEGDFVAVVRVTGELVPGTDPPKHRGRALPNTFQGAGLILWQDAKNYVRIERSARTERGGIVLATEAVLEIVKGGKMAGYAYPRIPDGPVYLRVERTGGALSFLYGPDGRMWIAFQKLAVAFPSRVQVGLIASNMSRLPLTARFEDFVLVTNKKQGDEGKAR